jgi:H+/Cl- antiporter ClcA
MPRWRRPTEEQIREFQPRFWARTIVLVVIAAYVIAFVLENRKHVHLHFVLFTAKVSLIWLILLILAIGVIGGALVSQLHRRRRRHERS